MKISEIGGYVAKWLISASFFILGCVFLMKVADTGSIKPIIVSIVSFGVVFWLYKEEGTINKPRVFATAFSIVAAALAATYLYFDYPVFNISFGISWWVWTAIIGIPVMAIAKKKFE